MTINIGDRVKDKITGLTGIVVSRHDYLHGCARFCIQPEILHEGKPVEQSTFDELQLDLVEAGVIQVGGRDKGGPRQEPSRPAVPRPR